MQFPIDFENKIICGDCLDIMKDIPDSSIDLVVTSPPYNLGINKTFGKHITKNWKGKWNNSKLQSAGYDVHDDYMPEDKYIAWQKKIWQNAFVLSKTPELSFTTRNGASKKVFGRCAQRLLRVCQFVRLLSGRRRAASTSMRDTSCHPMSLFM